MSYNKLYYNSVGFNGVDKDFGPSFICPRCERAFRDDQKGIAAPINTTVKFNQQIVFKCPHCDTTINLYVALTRFDTGKEGICISVENIDPDWMEKRLE